MKKRMFLALVLGLVLTGGANAQFNSYTVHLDGPIHPMQEGIKLEYRFPDVDTVFVKIYYEMGRHMYMEERGSYPGGQFIIRRSDDLLTDTVDGYGGLTTFKIYRFNEKEQLMSKQEYYPTGIGMDLEDDLKKKVYGYDRKGRLVSITEHLVGSVDSSKDSIIKTTTFDHGRDAAPTDSGYIYTFHTSETSTKKWEYTLDSLGRVSRIRGYDVEGDVYHRFIDGKDYRWGDIHFYYTDTSCVEFGWNIVRGGHWGRIEHAFNERGYMISETEEYLSADGEKWHIVNRHGWSYVYSKDNPDANEPVPTMLPSVEAFYANGTVRVTADADAKFDVAVYNVQGQLVAAINGNTCQANISLADAPSGVYFVRVMVGGQAVTRKVLKD